jgi:acyl-CoA thioesterase-1
VAYGARRAGRKALLGIVAALSLSSVAAAEEAVIAALGDSLTQGYGLPQEQGFVPELERWLAARGHDVRLINAGVSGDTTAGGLSRVGWTLTDEVDAMIVALGGNDLLRGIAPEVSRANLDGILSAATEAGVEVLLVGQDAPGNYGPDYEAAFEAIFPALAAEYDTLLFRDFLAGLTEGRSRDDALRDLMQPDGIHPNAAGVEAIVEALGPEVEELIARVRQAGG